MSRADLPCLSTEHTVSRAACTTMGRSMEASKASVSGINPRILIQVVAVAEGLAHVH